MKQTEIEGIKFIGADDKDIETYRKQIEESLRNNSYGAFECDSRCFTDHALSGSTSPITSHPTTAFAVQKKTMSVEEANSSRIENYKKDLEKANFLYTKVTPDKKIMKWLDSKLDELYSGEKTKKLPEINIFLERLKDKEAVIKQLKGTGMSNVCFKLNFYDYDKDTGIAQYPTIKKIEFYRGLEKDPIDVDDKDIVKQFTLNNLIMCNISDTKDELYYKIKEDSLEIITRKVLLEEFQL